MLTTAFVESKGLHLEGNGGPNPKCFLDGAAFMSPQRGASGTIWKCIPRNNGYFQLTTADVEDRGLVLEGNGGVHPQCQLGGAALMSSQRNATGTFWKAIPRDDGYFQLTTKLLEEKCLVLEGNGGANPKNVLDGAAFMSEQRNATGTLWRIIEC